jgi:hypothetical protein
VRGILAALVLLAATLGAGAAAAHELRPSFLEIRETAPGAFETRLRVSTVGAARVRLSATFPEICRDTAPPAVVAGGGAEITRRTIVCDAPIGGETVAIEGLRGTLNDVIVRIEGPSGQVRTVRVMPEDPAFVMASAQTRLAVARTYAVLGMQHILLGLDHLLFVLALLLLIRSPRMLLATITAFTVAHSITLALSAVGLAQAPQGLVEALVALSIVIVAVEIVEKERGRGEAALAPWKVAFAFGLLHGLGFGGALAEIGLPAGEIPLALLAFNVGVEAGQLLVVAVALAATASLALLLAIRLPGARHWLGYAIGGVSATWFAQRVGGFITAI